MPHPSTASNSILKHVFSTLLIASGLCAVASPAAAAGAGALGTTGAFVQAGIGDTTNAVVAGAVWDWGWQRSTAFGELSGHWDFSVGRWQVRQADNSAPHDWVGQIGFTPVLRLTPRAWGGRWFVEGGIGANLLVPTLRARDKRFSTAFNFGDHIAVGRRFGEAAEHELALRIQHFSNGGIERPNPGEDFVQLRYTRHF